MTDSTATIVGNLTRDPELRFTADGKTVTNLGVAVNRKWQNRQTGTTEEQTSYFAVTAFGDLAANAGACLTKGARVVVTGRLEQRSYETQAGETRSVIEIIADDIAPSLRWAQATIERNPRKDDGRPADLPARRPTQQSAPLPGDEEPF